MDIQKFLKKYFETEHTAKEAVEMLKDMGIAESDAKHAVSLFMKRPSVGFDEHD